MRARYEEDTLISQEWIKSVIVTVYWIMAERKVIMIEGGVV